MLLTRFIAVASVLFLVFFFSGRGRHSSWFKGMGFHRGSFRISQVWACLVRCCLVCSVWSGLVWSGQVWFGLVWSGLVWSGLTWSVWAGLVLRRLERSGVS